MARKPESQEPKRYANCLQVEFSADEFVLNFGQTFEGEQMIHTGIVTTPRCLRSFLRTIASSETKHRSMYPSGPDGEK